MLIVAVTGIRPAAAAWSPNEEERRKALLSYLLQALPYIVWDNIPRGFQISCAHIEKSCTSESYSDRVLGVSETVTTSAATIHFFTGNNIGPRGDLSSRSLVTRLDVNRPDPENREFKHPDPIAWTEAHRGEILNALYTIALGNPSFHQTGAVSGETRFKTWWHLVGRAVEHAAAQHKKHVDGLAEDADKNCPPEPIKFKDLFLTQEEDDQESADLADALGALSDQWPEEARFGAKDVAGLINTAGDAPSADTRENGQTVREFLFPGPQSSQLVGAKNVTKRLQRHIGDPVRAGDFVLTLQRKQDSHTKNFVFWVTSRRSDR
jgi:hypothetical protein